MSTNTSDLPTENNLSIISIMTKELNFEIKLSSAPSALGVARQMDAFYQIGRKKYPSLQRNEHHTAEVFDPMGALIAGAYFIKFQELLSIESFWVEDVHQGLKIGQKLYDAIEAFARTAQCEYIVGTVPSYYSGALEFWKKQGGSVFGEINLAGSGNKILYVRKNIRS